MLARCGAKNSPSRRVAAPTLAVVARKTGDDAADVRAYRSATKTRQASPLLSGQVTVDKEKTKKTDPFLQKD